MVCLVFSKPLNFSYICPQDIFLVVWWNIQVLFCKFRCSVMFFFFWTAQASCRISSNEHCFSLDHIFMGLVLLWTLKYLDSNIWNPDLDLTLFRFFALTQTQPFSGLSLGSNLTTQVLTWTWTQTELVLTTTLTVVKRLSSLKLPLYDSSRQKMVERILKT